MKVNELIYKPSYQFQCDLETVLICSEAQAIEFGDPYNLTLVLNETFIKKSIPITLISKSKTLEINTINKHTAYILVNYDDFTRLSINEINYNYGDSNLITMPGSSFITTLNYAEQPQEACSVYMINLIPDNQGKVLIRSDSDFAIKILD